MWKWEWICWFIKLISRNPSQRVRRFRRLIEWLSREADVDGTWWSVFREYPKQAAASSVSLLRDVDKKSNDQIAVVIQGPVIEKDDLTIETLKLYRQTMPESRLVLSTWNDIPNETHDKIEAMGVTVVTSEKPKHAGPHNLNLQIKSTQRGLIAARRLGCRYTMKTRADARIHLPDADRFCSDLLAQFPINADGGQKERLLVVDFATRLYVPYHPSDILMFGRTDDLLAYWSLDLCGPEMQFRVCDEFEEMLGQSIPEVVLCRSFLERTGTRLSDDLEQWWEILSNRFVVIDRDMVDLFWPKYNYNVNQRLENQVDEGNMAFCHFAQWMQLYSRPMQPAITLQQLRQQRVNQKIELANECAELP